MWDCSNVELDAIAIDTYVVGTYMAIGWVLLTVFVPHYVVFFANAYTLILVHYLSGRCALSTQSALVDDTDSAWERRVVFSSEISFRPACACDCACPHLCSCRPKSACMQDSTGGGPVFSSSSPLLNKRASRCLRICIGGLFLSVGVQ